jgi:site-specific DNA recombinase
MALNEYAQMNGYTVPSEWIFQDEGYSGSVLVRPALERLRDLIAEGQIETILIYSPDRLSRKYAYQVLLMEEFSKHGTEVLFIKSPKATTPEEELLLQFQGMIAEYERAQIAERHRRGKRYRAKTGLINVLCGAPYGYRYVRKTETSSAFYEVIEEEASIVREVYRLYTEEMLSMGTIVRWLDSNSIPTRKRISSWDRSVVWAILRNPAYKGTACFGKTERTQRQKITRRLRMRGGFSVRSSASRERPREEWIEIPVPAIVSEETFALAQERLKANKLFAFRATKVPTLLQGILVCSKCGYAYYRSATRTSRKKIYYYRCLGSDDYRYTNGRICHSKPIRQDYLDDLVWQHLIQLLENPDLIRTEIERRVEEVRDSNPTKVRKETLLRQMKRTQKGIDRLLDAYQESLLPLEELRKRIPELRKREAALKSELQTLETRAMDQEKYRELARSLEEFLSRLRQSAKNLDVITKQKILRLLVKEIFVDPDDTLTIKHSIPIPGSNTLDGREAQSYQLCRGGTKPYPCQYLPSLYLRPVV